MSEATIEEAASLDFEPWQHEAGEWNPPSNREWCEAVNPHLFVVRLAWLSLFKSKPELMQAVAAADDDTGETLNGRWSDAIAFLKPMVLVLETAQARLVCAAASVIVTDPQP